MLRRLFILVLLLTLVLTNSTCGGGENDPQQNVAALAATQSKASAKVEWFRFKDALVKAKEEKKLVLIEFYTDWCGYCKKFHRETLKDKKVTQMLADNFVAVRLNAENPKERLEYKGQSHTNVEFTRYFGVNGYPTLAFLNSDGDPITLIPGFVSASKFLPILDYLHQRCYLANVSFNDFVKKGRCR
jgi:thioredoxin-related protein